MLRRLIVFMLLTCLALPVSTGRAETIDAAHLPPAALIEKYGFADGDIGFVLLDGETGQVRAEQAADSLFIPASVAKLATVFAADQILGPDYHFSTKLFRRGNDLYLQGGGDPVLTSRDLKILATQLAAARAEGGWHAFYYDGNLVPTSATINDRQPYAASYDPAVGALNVDFNRVAVIWSRTHKDAAPAFQVKTLSDGFEVPVDWLKFTAATDAPPNAPFIYDGAADAERWLYAPNLEGHGSLFLPVKEADLHTARVFRRIAAGLGIALPDPRAAAVPVDAVAIGEIDSKLLSDIVPGLLQYSNNLTAELIGVAAARKLAGRPQSLAQSSLVLTDWLKTHLPSIDWQGFFLANHSGLSTASRVTPRQIALLLTAMMRDPVLAQTLPPKSIEAPAKIGRKMAEAGKTKATKHKVFGPPIVFGKSGTMDYASGLAGTLATHDGQHLIFAIFVIDRDRRAALDASFDPRVLNPTGEMRHWTGRARALEAALLRNWAVAY